MKKYKPIKRSLTSNLMAGVVHFAYFKTRQFIILNPTATRVSLNFWCMIPVS